MINDKRLLLLLLVVVSMLFLTWGCASKGKVKSSKAAPSSPPPKKIIVTSKKPQVKPPSRAFTAQEEPDLKEQEPEKTRRPVTEVEKTYLTEKEDRKIVSLDFHEEKLGNVLKIFSTLTGKNVVAKENISDLEVTVFLKDISTRAAIEVICKQYGLWYEENKDYIRIMKLEDYGKIVMAGDWIKVLMFKGQELADVLRVFSRRTGKNVVCNENIGKQKVNLLVRDVPVMVAIEIICKKYNLWYREDKGGNYICLMKAEDYGKDMRLKYEVKTRVFNLKYVSAPQLADSIACVMGNRVEYALPANLRSYEHIKLPDLDKEEGKIEQAKAEADITKKIEIPKFEEELTSDKLGELIEKKMDLMLTAEDLRWINKEIGFAIITIFLRNNSIIASSTDNRILDEIAALIDRLDTPTPQVLVECRILSVNLSDDFTSFFQITNLAYREEGGVSFGPDTRLWSMPFFGVAGANVLYNFIDDRWKLDVTLKLLQEDGVINVIATPMIVAAQNTQAEVFVGLRGVPFFTNVEIVPAVFDDDGNLISPSYSSPTYEITPEVGTKLRITPQINEDMSVTLRIFIERSRIREEAAEIQYKDFDEEGNPLPGWASTNVDMLGSNTINTIIAVSKGLTLALGGLVEEKDSVIESKVPFLGDLPIIGFFFKDHETKKERIETIFLLTPHILMAPEEASEVTEKVIKDFEHPAIKEGKGKLFEFDEEKRKLRRTE